jgi:hypothetical protein
MDRLDDSKENDIGALSADECQLLEDFRQCSPRRKEVIVKFARKLSRLAIPLHINHEVTNILPFRRRRDDY